MKFLSSSGEFLVDDFCHAVALLILAQDILIDASSYPTEKIGSCAKSFRQLGLGYSNLGALLMTLGMAYDSDEAREWAAQITSLMTGEAYRISAKIAENMGAFGGYLQNSAAMTEVIHMHNCAAKGLSRSIAPESLTDGARQAWDEAVQFGQHYGFRNSQVTVLAPTDTISFMMDCDTTGIEPELSLVKYKKLVGGGYLKMVNGSVVRALRELGYSQDERNSIIEHIDRESGIEGSPYLKDEHLAVFDCALKPAKSKRMIHYMGHLRMMSAVQPFLSGAISKTVNLPEDTTVDEIFDIYLSAWNMGLKAVALYRDGSKRTQPLSSTKTKVEIGKPSRRRLPDERQAITHKFSVGGLEGYITVGLYEDGTPGEIFVVVAKEGSTLSGVMDAFATSISMALQYGVPLYDLVRKFSHLRFEPSGFTNYQDIPMAKSIVDYIFRWLGLKFLRPDQKDALGLCTHSEKKARTESNSENKETVSNNATSSVQYEDAPPCIVCGSGLMVRSGACYVCLNCGAQGGCG